MQAPSIRTSRSWAVSVAFDKCIDDSHDLCDDAFWDPIVSALRRGKYSGFLASPPCETFSAANVGILLSL